LGVGSLRNGRAEGKQANKGQPRGTPCVTQGRTKPVRGVTAAYQYCFNFNLFKFRLAKRSAVIFHHYIPKNNNKKK